MNLSLTDAFSRFGAKPSNRLRGLFRDGNRWSHGAQLLERPFLDIRPRASCATRTDSPGSRPEPRLPGSWQHLTLARDGALPIRMIVTAVAGETTGSRCHVRPEPDW